MNTPVENIVKAVIPAVLVLCGIALWILPKTGIAKRIRGAERGFIVSQWLGILTGVTGLAATFRMPGLIVESHLMWLILTPFVVMEIYWLLVARVRRMNSVFDEKQDADMARAGGLAMAFSIPVMTGFFLWSQGRAGHPLLWFPCFLFTVILLFSSGVLLAYRRS